MGSNYISNPMDFTYKEGNAVDFRKTFDLTGNDNDQMLRMYLSKAGLSDNIDHLTPQERKAFIYDIVKSNKNPGYWRPSVLPRESPNATLHRRNPSTESRADSESSTTISSIDDIPPASMTFNYNHFTQVSTVPDSRGINLSSAEEQSVQGTLYERQFKQQKSNSPKKYNAPPTPPSPSTLVTRKGLKVEISGPMNFYHVSGDMTRDMSKNAFDLSGQFNDKSLKKYMIERGITEDDIAGMDTRELIKKIVQSKYTWTPIRKQYTGNTVPPPPSEIYMAPTPPVRHKNSNKGVALKVSAPQIPSGSLSSQEDIYLEVLPPDSRNTLRNERPVAPPPPLPPLNMHKPASVMRPPSTPSPPPPVHTSMPSRGHGKSEHAPPPPPPVPTSMPSRVHGKTEHAPPPPPPPPPIASVPSPPPPPPPLQLPTVNASNGGSPPPPPPSPPKMPILSNSNNNAPLPPPPPPLATAIVPQSAPQKKPEASGDNRDAFLESIRTGVTLKKVKKETHTRPGLGAIIDPQGNLPPQPTETVRQKPVKSEPQDFMSELRNATLKRIKKLENNPYAGETSESNC